MAHRFFPGLTLSSAYHRLWRLERSRFIRGHTDRQRKRFVWGLDQKGFRAIRDLLPDLREEGYKSEAIGHDLLVSAVQLGDWLTEAPEGAEFFTEQQLRRYQVEHYPSWVPRDDAHRPDGYWNVRDGTVKKTVALEVELSRQRHRRYESLGYFYARHEGIIRVLWIVPTTATAAAIAPELAKAVSGGASFHNFALAPKIQTMGWGTPIFYGPDAGKSIDEILACPVQTNRQPVCGSFTLDTRKSPHRSGKCIPFSWSDFCV